MEHLEAAVSPRDSRRLRTRREILAAARELLLEVGPEELSLRQVARRSDYSPGALYTYFASKEELVGALLAESLERLSAYLDRVSPELPPDRRIVETSQAYMDFARDNPVDLRCMLISFGPDLTSSTTALGKEVATRIGEIYRQGVEQGVLDGHGLSPAEMAYGTWALTHGMVSVSAVDTSGIAGDVSGQPRRVLEAWVRSLRSTGTA